MNAKQLVEAATEAEFLFAHGVGSVNSEPSTARNNHSEAKRIMAALRAALVALPPDARIVPAAMLLAAAKVCDESSTRFDNMGQKKSRDLMFNLAVTLRAAIGEST